MVRAVEMSLRELLQGSKQYRVPVYQRSFAWHESEFEQLWNDLIRLANARQEATGSEATHLVGTLVLEPAPEADHAEMSRYLVVDGQEWMIALTLLLAALRERRARMEGVEHLDRLNRQYLLNDRTDDLARLKVMPMQTDLAAYRACIETGHQAGSANSINEAYAYFGGRLAEEDDIERLEDTLTLTLTLSVVVLHSDSNLQSGKQQDRGAGIRVTPEGCSGSGARSCAGIERRSGGRHGAAGGVAGQPILGPPSGDAGATNIHVERAHGRYRTELHGQIVAGIVAGLVVATLAFGATYWLEDSVARRQEKLQREVLTQQIRLENLRFVRNALAAGGNLREFSALDLAGASLGGLDLSKADFSKSDLSGADLAGSSLQGADLSGANLKGVEATAADFSHAKLVLIEAGPPSRASESEIDPLRSFLDPWNMPGGNFRLANFSHAQMSSADMSHTLLLEADMSDAYLAKADLTGALIENGDLARANLNAATLHTAVLTGADLHQSNLTYAQAGEVNMEGANLRDADLSNSSFTMADLIGADLTNADLTGADLTNADLTGADLTNADLTGADLVGANLARANLSNAILANAVFSDTVLTNVLPEGSVGWIAIGSTS